MIIGLRAVSSDNNNQCSLVIAMALQNVFALVSLNKLCVRVRVASLMAPFLMTIYCCQAHLINGQVNRPTWLLF